MGAVRSPLVSGHRRGRDGATTDKSRGTLCACLHDADCGYRIQNTYSFTNEIVLLHATGGFGGFRLLSSQRAEAAWYRQPVSENWLGEPNLEEGEVRCSKIKNRSVLKPSVVVISASIVADPDGEPVASSVTVTDSNRWDAHRAAVWETDGVGSPLCGLGRTGNVIVPEE
eukprot:COSAG06_NODE_23856_length_679_cov_1.432759_1_plen_169_part_10